MRKKITGMLSGILLGFTGSMYAQTWANLANTGTGSFSSSIIKDYDKWGTTAGYFVGKFSGSNVVFGSTTLNNTPAATASSDAFLCRTNLGAINWAVRAGGANDQSFEKVLSTGTAIIVYGTYSGSITLYSTNTASLSLSGGSGFLAKYSTAGVIQWAVPFTGTVNDFAFMGNTLYTIGAASVVVYPASPKMAIKSFDMTTGAAGSINLQSSNTGILGRGIGADASNNFYSLIEAPSTFSLPGSPTFSPIQRDIIIIKYDAAGNYIWSREIDNTGGGSKYGTGLSCTTTGDVYVTGSYSGGSAYMDWPSTTSYVLANTGGKDAFVAKYNSAGTIQWAEKIGGAGDDVPLEMGMDGTNPIIVVQNNATNSVTLPGVCTTETYTSANSIADNKWYVIKYTSAGDIDFSAAPDVLNAGTFPVGVGPTGSNAGIAGSLIGTIDFGGTPVSGGSVYLATATKVGCKAAVATGIDEHSVDNIFSVYPNPGTGYFNIDADAFTGGQIDIYDISGKKIQSIALDGSIASKAVDLTGFNKGIYLLNLSFEGKHFSRKLILE